MGKKDWESYFDAFKKQNWKSARAALQRIAGNEKNNPQIHLKMGDLYQRTGDTGNAIKSYYTSARLLKAEGFSQKAIAIYKIILRLNPNYSQALTDVKILIEELESSKSLVFTGNSASNTPVQEKELYESQLLPQTTAPEGPKISDAVPQTPPPLTEPVADADVPKSDFKSEEKTPVSMEDTLFTTEPTGKTSEDLNWLETQTGLPEESLPERETPLNEPSSPEDLLSAGNSAETAPGQPKGPDDIQDLAVPLTERDLFIKKPELFYMMSEEDFMQLLTEFEQKTFSNNEPVVKEGGSGDTMYIIRSGAAKVIAHLFGKAILLATLKEGDVFGEVGFLTGRPRTASVVAAGTLTVFEISRLVLENIIEQNPEILSKLEDFYEIRTQDTIKKIKSE